MIPSIYFWQLCGFLVLYTCLSLYVRYKLKYRIRRIHLDAMQKQKVYAANKAHFESVLVHHSHKLQTLGDKSLRLSEKVDRLSLLVRNLRKRQISFVRSITWFKTEETDIRVLKVQAREQLAIDLENGGAIDYVISERYREDIKETEITVKARIKTLNMK